ncbi:hypothetical protein GIB67_003317 [Kingdonia uniflora]|uniref:Plant heme peroxidase family profile domain-containing protein n=1 Tax=Kingdonia uniflora TaxID=39325 RepID=A0A7J7P8U3_9MAGN|nr:hypothetical protein GIB67_003317 [Kingdonia uniflora]
MVCREERHSTVSGEKALCSRMQRISEGAMLGCTAHTFFRRFETKRQYPEEKADSSRMKVRSLRTSVGMGEVKGRVKRGLLPSDQLLFSGESTNPLITTYSTNYPAFLNDFANAMMKMGNLSPLKGSVGEVRLNCRRPN